MRNVIFITLDSLRADHVSSFGYQRDTTPFIDSLSDDFTVFRDAYAQGPSTLSSFLASIGGIYSLAAGKRMFLPSFATPVQSVFKEAGYSTAAFHSNPFISSFMGFSRDFDEFFDSFGSDKGQWEGRTYSEKQLKSGGWGLKTRVRNGVKVALRRSRTLHYMAISMRDAVSPPRVPYVRGDDLNKRVLTHLDGVEEPFFLWVHYMDTHSPFRPEPQELKEFTGRSMSRGKMIKINRMLRKGHPGIDRYIPELIDLYDTKIRLNDGYLRSLIDGLKERGLYDDAVIAIASDHGEEFMEHGIAGHKKRFYDQIMHVPILLKNGGTSRDEIPAKSSTHLVGMIDVPWTLVNRAGLTPPPTLMGQDLLTPRDAVFCEVWEGQGWKAAVRTPRWKLHHHQDIGAKELYDLKNDPGEDDDLHGKRPQVQEVLEGVLSDHVDHVQQWALKRSLASLAGPDTKGP